MGRLPLVQDFVRTLIRINIDKVTPKSKTYNAAEQSIRSFCIGKKNRIMCDTINVARSSDIIYSLVETAKASKLRLYEYFNYLLTEIPEHMR